MHSCLTQNKLSSLTDIGRHLLDGGAFNKICVEDIIENSECFLFWKNNNSTFIACNRKFSALGGLINPEFIVGKCDYDMPWRKEDARNYRNHDQEIINYAKPKINIEEPLYQADGAELIILTSKFPIYSNNRKKTGLIGIASDITEQKIFEKMLLEIHQNNQINPNIHNDYICKQLVELAYRLNKITEYLSCNKGHYVLNYNGKMIKLSTRHLQCIVELLRGKTTKQIGKALNLSPRTIEEYLNIIRKKFNCVAKNALIEIFLTCTGFIDSNA